ncbi:carbamoyltransferase family protein [Candidatus Pelagibacter sp. HIMB1521]|uniref:carbamoyltransferase family protein n=1 Tax=Candidatus Pelagibacter sp. HIMB1521 TaxID=3413344 RepID=UPI003F836EF1
MNVLGINVYHADTSACLLKNGNLIAACEEERFTRIKHYSGFPIYSIKFCLKKANISLKELDYITVNFNLNHNLYERFKFAFSNIKSTSLANKLLSLLNKRSLHSQFQEYFGENVKDKIIFVPHHISHISSSYFMSGFKDAVGVSIDATGDFSSMEISEFKNNKVNLISKNYYPHSLGILYQAITQFLGFKNYGDEYKVMALAAYGSPKYKKEFDKLVKFVPPYNFELNLEYFLHHKNFFFDNLNSSKPIFENLYSKKIEELLGSERYYKEELQQRHYDIASSLQNKFEEIILKIIKNIYLENHSNNLCLSGGCFFNSVLNGKIYKSSKFDKIFFHANVGDAGGSVGSSFYQFNEISKNFKNTIQDNYFIGPSYSDEQAKNLIKKNEKFLGDFSIDYGLNFEKIIEVVTDILSKSGLVAWFQDEMEWGPRALGNRSLLIDPKNKFAKDILNTKIKLREEFRPFAASILEEHTHEYFDVNNKDDKFPNMNVVLKANSICKNKFPAIVHVDGSSRIQTVNKNQNFKFYKLLNEFKKKTGSPILLNTSLNIDEPICESPVNVIETFSRTKIDCIVIQNTLIIRKI